MKGEKMDDEPEIPDDELRSDSEMEKDEEVDESDNQSDESSFNFSEQPKVPLNTDPELLDPTLGKFKYGIIYLSYIPEGLNVKLLREIMGQFGDVGRIYLEPEKNQKKHRSYSEGWIEFKKKRVAKKVAKILNATPLKYGRKNGKMNGQVWSIKYLHKFKWAHLTEQLAHDRAVNDQKRRFELSQAKKQVAFYQDMTERSRKQKKIQKKRGDITDKQESHNPNKFSSRQKKPVGEGNEFAVSVDQDLLENIFKKVS